MTTETEQAGEASAVDEGRAVRTATIKLVLPVGSLEDQEFDLERACRALTAFGSPIVEGMDIATATEAREVVRK